MDPYASYPGERLKQNGSSLQHYKRGQTGGVPAGVTRVGIGTRKSHVDDQNRLRSMVSSALVNISKKKDKEPNHGVLDLHDVLAEAEAKGIDLTRHYSMQELHHGPNVSTSLTFSNFQLGRIVLIPHLIPSLDPNMPADDENAVWSKVGPLCVKRRPAIVMAIYRDRMIVLPMYTHNSNGTNNKPEYVQRLALHLVAGNPDRSIPRDRMIRCDTLPFKNKSGASIVYPTDPYSVAYCWPLGTQYLGKLDQSSTQRLLNEYRWHQQAGMIAVAQQQQYINSQRSRVSIAGLTAGIGQTSIKADTTSRLVAKSKA